VGNIVASGCSPSGIAFNKEGRLFMVDGDKVYRLTPNADTPPVADVYATGVPGANGLAFDKKGNLWTGDGTTGLGRVWKIAPCSTLPCPAVEVFRIQPMRNGTDFGGDVVAQTGITSQGVGRQNRTFPPGTLIITVPASAAPTDVTPAGGQDLVANGVAFDKNGNLFVADTARGAIWKVRFGANGAVLNDTGCDSTFPANTLCLNSIFVTHPLLEGTDGIALDTAGNIWNSANERNAIVLVTPKATVREIFRNPPDATTLLRNTGPLEFPTSPFLLGRVFCTANSDGNRRDNSPATAGEIKAAGPDRGKISCLTDDSGNFIQLNNPGLPLPVQ
jgi:sugar lactone lactonase YvrE